MSAPTPKYYNVTAAGNGNIADLTTNSGHAGPKGTLLTVWDFGSDQASTWDAKCLAIGFEGNTAQQLKFWIYDVISDVNGTPNAENWFDGTPWSLRARVSKNFIDPATFTDSDIISSPWVDLPHGTSATGWALADAIIALNPGNDGTTNLLVDSTEFTSPQQKMVNGFIYVAIKPEANALDGEHLGWGFRLSAVYP